MFTFVYHAKIELKFKLISFCSW